MRSAAAWLISFALCSAYGASVAPHATGVPLTVVYQFDGLYSARSFAELKQELASILKDTNIRVDWRERNQVGSSESFDNLVVVKFRGVCQIDAASDSDPQPGPLAFTHRSDGVILPFSEVECDRVRSSLRRVRSDIVFGRALARVLAHELYHVLAGTETHSPQGITQRALTGSDLGGDRLELSQDELTRMLR